LSASLTVRKDMDAGAVGRIPRLNEFAGANFILG